MTELKLAKATALALAVCITLPAAASAAPGCTVSKVGLDCPGDTRAEIMEALADDETSKIFARPQAFARELGITAALREEFRIDLERVRRTIERQQRADRRAERRGQIDGTEFAKREATYQKAIANYREGYWFYQNLIWGNEN